MRCNIELSIWNIPEGVGTVLASHVREYTKLFILKLQDISVDSMNNVLWKEDVYLHSGKNKCASFNLSVKWLLFFS